MTERGDDNVMGRIASPKYDQAANLFLLDGRFARKRQLTVGQSISCHRYHCRILSQLFRDNFVQRVRRRMMIVEVKSTVLDWAEGRHSSFFQRLNIGSAVFYQIQSARARFLQHGGYWKKHRLDERRTFHIESGRMTRS